jgi:cation:H+ antiporter
MFLWFGFLTSAAVIVYCGARLSRYGDIIAEKTGLGRTWIGILMMASVTSMPELMTGISAVTYVGAPDIAVGDILGSCVFNLLILACLDVAERGTPISARAQQGHVLSAGFGILLLSLVSISLFRGEHIRPFGWIGLYSLLYAAIYLMAIRLVYFYEKRQLARFIGQRAEEFRYQDIRLKSALINYGWNALVVIGAAALLPRFGAGIAEATGLGQTFVGTIFVAIATSLPEVVVSVAAVKIGAIDLAIANLLGSNLFNILILAVDDVFFIQGPILSHVDHSQILSALAAIAMTSIAIIGLTYRAEKKLLRMSWDSIAMIFVYIANLMLLYMYK